MRFAIPLLAASAIFAATETSPVNFVRDVAPVLSKAGCMSGTCHGAAKGKNGFKLSLRGYDPQFDYEALLYDLGGRRFNRADPGRSLMLAKPTQQVAHGGGLRFEVNSGVLQDHLQLDRAGRTVRRSGEGCRQVARCRAERNSDGQAGRDGDGEDRRHVQRRRYARCDAGSE